MACREAEPRDPRNFGVERRRHERFEVSEPVSCIMASGRVEAMTRDVSHGGAFVLTGGAFRAVPGEMVAVFFPDRCDAPEDRTYLLARVVRTVAGPVLGAGVQWLHAVTLATPSRLATFLKQTLRMDHVTVRLEPFGKGQFRSVHVFGDAPRRLPAVIPVEAASSTAPPPPGQGPSRARLRPGSGSMVRPAGPSEVSIEACVAPRVGPPVTGRITRLGTGGMFVETPGPPTAPLGGTVIVRLNVRVRSGPVPVRCLCRVEEVAWGRGGGARGYGLTVLRVEEEGGRGVFERYLRWLDGRGGVPLR